MAANDKDTIYIDVDDEITGIIDKVKASDKKVVALVLPKRAAVFQSIVNMKLLKRAAGSSKKNLVLITTEAGLLPLAGAAGIHVAKTLTSKPEIPTGPDIDTEAEEVDENEAIEAPLDDSKSVGQLAAAGAIGAAAAKGDDVETVVLDDEDLPPEASDKTKPKTFTPPKKDKKLKVPDFDRFRLMLIAGGCLLVLLIIGAIVGGSVLPKAVINIKTDATTVDLNEDLNLLTTVKTLDEKTNTLPAKVAQTQKTYSQQVPTTGQKNNGNKASGSVSITNCSGTDASLPAGTGLSSGGNTYITQSSVTVPDSNYTITGTCKKDGKASVDVIAQSGGSSYNLPGGSSFTVAGNSKLTGSGGTSGGTDNIVRTVNQNDINSAKAKIVANDNELKQTLSDQLKKDKWYPIPATYSAGTPNSTNSAEVGAVADNVTVTENVTYTMFGVKQKDLEKIFTNAINEQIDEKQQAVLNNGMSKAVYNVDELKPDSAKLTMSATAEAGPDINVEGIKAEAAGKKPGAVKSELEKNPDIKSVDVKLSPFWVSSVPKNQSKITVVIAKPQASNKSSDANNP